MVTDQRGVAMRDFIRLMGARGGPKRVRFGEICLYFAALSVVTLRMIIRLTYVMGW